MCKRTHGMITCYRWFYYFGTLCVGVETPTYKLSQKIQDKTEAISESVSTIDGNSPISKWAFLSKIKDLFPKGKNQYQFTDKQKEEAKILAGMIDNLPTLN